MKPNSRGRFNGRHNNNQSRGSRPQTIFRNTALESTGPCGKLRGTALQLFEKYQIAAKDAMIQNDDILAETCLQYADHYMHLQNQAIANEEAMHAQQQALRQAQEPVMVEQPVEETAEPEAIDESPLSDGELKVIDLSIPVESMNKDLAPNPAEKPQRKILRPRTKTMDDKAPSDV